MSEKRDDGGNAFPAFETIDQWDKDAEKYREQIAPMGGMSLRDFFAAKAMQAIVGNDNAVMALSVQPLHQQLDSLAAKSYAIADAMLAERAK